MAKWWPFTLTLQGLLLKGEPREIARIQYELEGEEQDRAIVEIQEKDETNKKMRMLNIDLQYNHIDKYDYEIKRIDITIHDEKKNALEKLKTTRKFEKITKEEYDYQLADIEYKDHEDLPFVKLALDREYNKISQNEYDKRVYSLKNQPWVGVLSNEYNPGDKSDGFTFELDWNDAFVDMLRTEGYNGPSDEAIVEQWFEDKSTDTYLSVLEDEVHSLSEEDTMGLPRTRTRKERDEKVKKTKHS